MAIVILAKQRLRMTATVHNVFPRGGGTLWLHTSPEDRAAIRKRWPGRTDLDLDAPYEGVSINQQLKRSRPYFTTRLERTAPND